MPDKKVFTTQMPIDDFEQMETIRKALGKKRNEFIMYLIDKLKETKK